ncbi:MAG TPA: hypothetical protein PKY73_18320 [Hyphomonas sp.]|nr:hypothetical protein [Hyphomonas sp.]
MPYRPRNDVPRLSGRPPTAPSQNGRPTQTVFRRFFDLIERLERPGSSPSAPPAGKSAAHARPTIGRGGRS